jgi:hypothetical protein
MTTAPDIVFADTSSLRSRLEGLKWEGASLGALDAVSLLLDGNRPHVLILGAAEAEAVWRDVETQALDAPVFPLLIGRPDDMSGDAAALLRLAPILESPTDDSILWKARQLLHRHGELYSTLQAVDPNVKALAQNAACEWIRCSVGIVGLVRVDRSASMVDLGDQLEALRLAAHATVDRIPAARLSTDDLWTLLLIVAVPWTRAELARSDSEVSILSKFTSDTKGSRKLIMSADESVTSLVGPIVGAGANWHPSSDDPLRDHLRRVVKDSEELQALDVLFKKRFPSDDVDRLIAALGKKS